MPGPPGSKAPRTAASARAPQRKAWSWPRAVFLSSPKASASRSRKASRLLVYLQLHRRQILAQLAGTAALLALFLGLLSLVSHLTSRATESSLPDAADAGGAHHASSWGGWRERRRGDLPHVALDIQSAAAKRGWGTDVYVAARESEALGTWDPRKGLDVEALDVHAAMAGNLLLGAELRVALNASAPFFLAAAVAGGLRRRRDNLTFSEVQQWLEFLRYAGVARVFWYDTARSKEDQLEASMQPYTASGFVSYYHLPTLFASTNSSRTDRDKAIAHCLTHHGSQTHWLLLLHSFLEYPVVPADVAPGFLDRFLRDYEAQSPSASQLLLQMFVVDGPPTKPSSPILIDRFTQRRFESQGASLRPPAVLLPVLRPPDVLLLLWHPLEHFEMARGTTRVLPAGVLRVLRYEGALGGLVSMSVSHVQDRTLAPLSEELARMVEQRRPKKGRRSWWSFFS